jgi:hypothetical protein
MTVAPQGGGGLQGGGDCKAASRSQSAPHMHVLSRPGHGHNDARSTLVCASFAKMSPWCLDIVWSHVDKIRGQTRGRGIQLRIWGGHAAHCHRSKEELPLLLENDQEQGLQTAYQAYPPFVRLLCNNQHCFTFVFWYRPR